MEEGDEVICRDDKLTGCVTEEPKRPCNMEGCWGSEYQIKWEDGDTTWVCGGGMGWDSSKSRWYFY